MIYITLSPLIPLPLSKGKGENFFKKRGFAPLGLPILELGDMLLLDTPY
jgi:hypothetical protein